MTSHSRILPEVSHIGGATVELSTVITCYIVTYQILKCSKGERVRLFMGKFWFFLDREALQFVQMYSSFTLVQADIIIVHVITYIVGLACPCPQKWWMIKGCHRYGRIFHFHAIPLCP